MKPYFLLPSPSRHFSVSPSIYYRLSYLVLIFWLITFPSFAQKKLWDKTFGGDREDELTMVQQTQDGGFILGGNSTSSISGDKSEAPKGKDQYGAPLKDYWIIKLKADGTKVWDKTIGGNNGDRLASVQQTKDGGYILGGTSDSGKSSDKSEASKGGADFWLVKLDANGTKEWDKTIGGNGGDLLVSVQQTLDGGYLLGGTSESGKSGDKSEANKGYGDYWIVKISANGSKLWDKTIGGDREDELKTVQQTQDGGYILGGTSWSDKSGDKSEDRKLKLEFYNTNDYWVVKLNPDRTKAWDKTIGGDKEDDLASLQQTSDGGYILGGTSRSSKGADKSQERINICGDGRCEQDYWVVKLEANGSKEWDKTIGGDNYDNLVSVKQTADGSYILGGISSSGTSADKTQPTRDLDKYEPYDYWIVKLKENGGKIWDKTYGGDDFDYLASMGHTSDGGFILGGTSRSGKSSEKSEGNKGDKRFFDYWIVKIDNKNTNLSQNVFFNPIPYKNFGEPPFALTASSDSGLPVTFQVVSGPAKVQGNILTLTGTGTVTVKALQVGNATYEPAEALQTFVVGTAPVFTKQWDKTLGGDRLDELTEIQQTQDGGYIIGGTSDSGKSGDKSEGSRDNYNLGDYWIIKLAADGRKEWDKTFGGNRNDILTVVRQTRDGGYILAGWSNSDISGDKSEEISGYNEYGDPYKHFWIVKIKADGTKEWDKVLGGDRDDWPITVYQTQDGGYLFGGYSWSNISGDKSEACRGGGRLLANKNGYQGQQRMGQNPWRE